MKKRNWAVGLTTIEMVIVLALFGFVLVSVVGLHLVALSAGTAAQTSSIAANLARARMEELLSLPPDALKAENNTERRRQIPSGTGRIYEVHTAIVSPDPTRLDLTVMVTWQLAYGAACAAGSSDGCTGTPVMYTRTLQTRIQAPVQP